MKTVQYVPSAVPTEISIRLLDWLRREFQAIGRFIGILEERTATAWDDLRAPASLINPVGPTGMPDRDEDGSLLFDATTTEQIPVIFQLPHSWAQTGIRPHIHWQKTTDVAGGVSWQLRYRLIDTGGTTPAWSTWANHSVRSEVLGANQNSIIDAWDEIDMTGMGLSCILSLQIRRLPSAAADTYPADVRLWEVDCHWQRKNFGTIPEYPQ